MITKTVTKLAVLAATTSYVACSVANDSSELLETAENPAVVPGAGADGICLYVSEDGLTWSKDRRLCFKGEEQGTMLVTLKKDSQAYYRGRYQPAPIQCEDGQGYCDKLNLSFGNGDSLYDFDGARDPGAVALIPALERFRFNSSFETYGSVAQENGIEIHSGILVSNGLANLSPTNVYFRNVRPESADLSSNHGFTCKLGQSGESALSACSVNKEIPAKTLRQTVVINAPSWKIYDVLMLADKFSQFSGFPAEIEKSTKSHFQNYFRLFIQNAPDGSEISINGATLQSSRRSNGYVIQLWRPIVAPESYYTLVRFDLERIDSSKTRVKLTQIGVPAEHYEFISQGWHKFYWNPLNENL